MISLYFKNNFLVTIPPIASPQIFSTGSDGFVKAAIYGKPRRKKIEWSYISSTGVKSTVASLDVNDDLVNGSKFVVSTSGLTIKNIEKSDSGEYEVSTSIIGSRISQKVIVDVGGKIFLFRRNNDKFNVIKVIEEHVLLFLIKKYFN